MAENIKEYDDEIDLLSLFETIWEGKWKILSIITVSLLSVFGFNTVLPNKIFIAQTEIKPITSTELDKYRLFNASLKRFDSENVEVDIFNISKESLLSLYIEEIEEGTLLETAIDKVELINKNDFENDNDYRDATQKFASKVKILRPINGNGKAKGKIRLHHVLNAEYNDEDKWKELLYFVNNEANKRVKNILTNRFKNIVSLVYQNQSFRVRDINIAINNAKKDYERETNDKLAFLDEQAKMARKLGIKRNTIESQKFDTQTTVLTNVKTDTPFYLRGYEAIEEEIKLIKSRKNKDAFTKNLFKLEKDKRKLEQDEKIQRAIKLFDKTPLKQDGFKAVLFTVAATDFETINKRNLFYALALVLGGMIGVFYVLISKALINRKAITAQS